ncbi:MAG TPA: ABC transporter permease [Verrucomicrobiae bacterium]|nr:ABC transporter permease [Verrucomicrobiae bacterium]
MNETAATSIPIAGNETSSVAPKRPVATKPERLDWPRKMISAIAPPLISFAIFLFVWSQIAGHVKVSFGSIPGPLAVWKQAEVLWNDHWIERQKEAQFYSELAKRRADFLAKNPGESFPDVKYAGPPTYFDQICTSLETVFTGFFIGSLIAVPAGILCGLSRPIHNALNPFIQIFKPVSPLAWLPIVMILVSALYNPPHPWFEKAFLTSAITVAMCSLWPTLINTALGVASIDKDYLNVARVLKLGWWKQIWKIILPATLPYIFTGLRLSLGVGWMVLIAAEMLAQNPGLGKFVWDMFQNGSSQTLAQIMVAVFTIGIIGFALDRLMLLLQRLVSYDAKGI